jgi:uncharacterized membrane protein
MGRKLEGYAETTKADKPRAFAQRFTGPAGARGEIAVTYSEARGGTDVTVELEYDLPMGLFTGIAEKLLGGSVERDLRHSMENFKELCQATVPARA